MPEGAEGQPPSRKEQGSIPEYKQEIVQYQDDQLALSITGETGAKFDFDKHKWSPTEPTGEGIVSTKSGNDYYIFTRHKRTHVVNTRESDKRGELVAADIEQYPAQLPPMEFGKPWKIPGFYTTSDVESILLRYKVAVSGHDVGRKIDGPNPFDKYQSLLRKPAR
jgi:hypothetical protein